MRLPVFIAAVLILSIGGCRTTTNPDVLSTGSLQERAVDSEERTEDQDIVVVALEVEHMPSIVGGMNAMNRPGFFGDLVS